MSSSDFLFRTLPQHIQNAIDGAFTATVASDDQRRRKESENTQAAGGFVVEPAADGFLVEDHQIDSNNDLDFREIPLDLVPSALQRLDLPPDDDDVLSVFRNAASGWTSASLGAAPADQQAKYVSRDDWRSVCAVLLEQRAGEDNQEDHASDQMEENEASPSDDYVEEQSSDLSSLNDSSDDYQEGTLRARRGKQSRAKKVENSNSSRVSTEMTSPTSRQRQVCLETFALFFPDVPLDNLETQKIRVSDLQRVSKLLGEKIKANEMLEMLEMFSTSPDKSVDINDFTRMMIAARLA